MRGTVLRSPQKRIVVFCQFGQTIIFESPQSRPDYFRPREFQGTKFGDTALHEPEVQKRTSDYNVSKANERALPGGESYP